MPALESLAYKVMELVGSLSKLELYKLFGELGEFVGSGCECRAYRWNGVIVKVMYSVHVDPSNMAKRRLAVDTFPDRFVPFEYFDSVDCVIVVQEECEQAGVPYDGDVYQFEREMSEHGFGDFCMGDNLGIYQGEIMAFDFVYYKSRDRSGWSD